MDSPFKAIAAAGALLRPLAGHAASARQMAHVADSREWREGYRRHLISKSVPPHEAADIAAKVAFRADLYPLAHDAFPQASSPRTPAPSEERPEDAPRSRPKKVDKLLDAGHEIAMTPPAGDDFPCR